MTAMEFCRAAGITRRMLQWWVDHRIVRRLKGYRWRFDDSELFRALIVRELRARGVSLRKIGRLKLAPAKADYIVLIRNRVEWADRESLIGHIERVHSPVLLISINDLREEFYAAMGAIRSVRDSHERSVSAMERRRGWSAAPPLQRSAA